jgi:hypothetical protein
MEGYAGEIYPGGVDITIEGNGATFDAKGKGSFFDVCSPGTLTVKNMTIKNGRAPNGGAGAIMVRDGANLTLDGCTFVNNTVGDGGGALIFWGGESNGNCTGLIKGCSFVGPISDNHNNIRIDYGNTSKVIFACPDGEVGTPVQIQGGYEVSITAIPPKELKCTKMYYCPNDGTQGCVPCDFTGCKGIKNQTECNSIFPDGCPKGPHWD